MFYDLKLQNIDNSAMFLYQIYHVIHKALFHIATLVKTHDCTAMIWSIAQALQNRPLFLTLNLICFNWLSVNFWYQRTACKVI